MIANQGLMPSAAGVEAIRKRAAVVLRPEVLSVRVDGGDRKRFLNGMLANDIGRLAPGQMQRSVKASAKGRVEGSLRVRCHDDTYILDLWEVSAGKVAQELIKFVVMDDVSLVDLSADREVVGIYGPQAASVLEQAGCSELPPTSLSFVEGSHGTLLRDDAFGVEGYEIHAVPGAKWVDRLVTAGALKVEAADLNAVRIEAAYPIDGVELDDAVIPLEAGLDEAIDLQKGCFIGQEVIARATHRGGVRRRLVGLRFDGELPAKGAELWPEGADKARGWVSSAVYSPTVQASIGLGFLHTDFADPGTKLRAQTGDHAVSAEVVSTPHVPVEIA